MAKKKIDKIIEVVRHYLGEEGPTMSTGSTPGKPGFSNAAPAKGPTAGFDPVMGKMERRKRPRYIWTKGIRKNWKKKEDK